MTDQIDPKLKEWATPRQAQFIDALIEHGTLGAAATALGIASPSNISDAIRVVKKKAARDGYAPGHFADGVAPGYRMGKVTVQRGPNGVERVWERQHPAEDSLDMIRKAMEACIADAATPLPRVKPPKRFDADLLTVIPMGDPHFGLLTWAKEVGEDFDLKIAEQVTFDAVDRLCALTPASETAMLLNLGDFFHADNSSNRTPRGGNALDVDSRFQNIADVGFRALVRCIRRMLEHHGKVIVRNNRGNHDPHQAFMLSLALNGMFHNEPRVHVEMTPASFYYYRWGKTLIGSTHGDGAKLADLPMIMANDAPMDWAASIWRVWHCGHFHHDQVKDAIGCRIETHRTLATGDAWHRHEGYRSFRDMKAIVYDLEYGEVNRVRCGVEQLAARP